MRTSDRLLARLREVGLAIPEGSRLVRVNPSRAMRNDGAWSWVALGPRGEELRIGSQWPMGELLAAPALVIGSIRAGAVRKDTEVVPGRPCTSCATGTETACRICQRPFCRPCFTDHHHEGYGTPTTDNR